MEWKVRGIRGATTVARNTVEAISEAVEELLEEIESRNQLKTEDVISVTFTTTRDLDAVFPAKIARQRPNWEHLALLDVQQMHVEGSLAKCVRVLIQINSLLPQSAMVHTYLRDAKNLRPDWSVAPVSAKASTEVRGHRSEVRGYTNS